LQRRLGAAGFAPAGAEAGVFCASTEAVLRHFQDQRGLRVTGVCDEECWRAIVESTWKLGDRLLVLSAPNLRGDDVGELQAALAKIGFDCGRVDGIFGPRTARALEDFQDNSGLLVDGVCGPATVRALSVLARQTGSGPGVSTVREFEATTQARTLADLRIAVGQFGGLGGLTRHLVQELRHRHATVAAQDEPDASIQSASANRFAAHVYVGFEAQPHTASSVHFYAVPQFESVGGRALAEAIAGQCSLWVPNWAPAVTGMRLPVLRETRMPAVVVTLGDVQHALDHADELVDAVVTALEQWAGAVRRSDRA
jgi:N-acetylmuramoyl-L-alanine amidase